MDISNALGYGVPFIVIMCGMGFILFSDWIAVKVIKHKHGIVYKYLIYDNNKRVFDVKADKVRQSLFRLDFFVDGELVATFKNKSWTNWHKVTI